MADKARCRAETVWRGPWPHETNSVIVAAKAITARSPVLHTHKTLA